MNYTISAAFVLDVDAEELGNREGDALHQDIVQHVVTLGELMRAKYPAREFKTLLAEIIIPIPEVEIAPRVGTEK
jgi:hypothetical protein